ncbi:LysR family transcriptional regulator [Vibrio ishigakensis]|uniref:LysR family transcriptional regulator n=1 Tax=Vibrio ishigakensis TaxID=1481914 RepID=UPI0021C268D8|nr:LysR family transcriptional regulator [Vibrio ishigakensis]
MSQITLSQLTAFVTVAKKKNYSKAAAALRKDRKTISEQVEYLELNLGYKLFEKSGRKLELTDKGEKLSHRAQLLSADISTFESFALSLFDTDLETLSVCFDESIPQIWLTSLRRSCLAKKINLDLIKVSREHGEKLLKTAQCQFGMFLAKGQVINSELYWKSLPPVSVSAFTHQDSLLLTQVPCSIRALASQKQRVYSSVTSNTDKYPLLLSDSRVFENDLDLLLGGLVDEPSWAFLPNHLEQKIPEPIKKIDLDVADEAQSIQLQPVLLWAIPYPDYSKMILKAIDKGN